MYGFFAVNDLDNPYKITYGRNETNNKIGQIFKGLLENKDGLGLDFGGSHDIISVQRIIDNVDMRSALSISAISPEDQTIGEIEIALALANILKNPTEDQKLILDAVEGLLKDIKKIEENAGQNPELSKAESDLLQMVAACLLAQGVPDLLKADDMTNLKGIFKDLGQSKDRLLMDYKDSIKPYYTNIVKELEANLAVLQLKGIVSKKITEEELRRFEPKEIDKILDAIRRSNDKSFEMEYILQQEAKYRKNYLDTPNRILEEAMKTMMRDFTQKLNKALEEKK
jgi:hypothetical protein